MMEGSRGATWTTGRRMGRGEVSCETVDRATALRTRRVT